MTEEFFFSLPDDSGSPISNLLLLSVVLNMCGLRDGTRETKIKQI